MTTEERERMNSLCIRIQEEKDHQRFEGLLRELDSVIASKQLRFQKGDDISRWQRRSRPWKTVPGAVQKVVKNIYRNDAETVEITIPEADDLFREIRIANTFTDVDGQPVKLTQGAGVDVTFEADSKDMVEKVEEVHI